MRHHQMELDELVGSGFSRFETVIVGIFVLMPADDLADLFHLFFIEALIHEIAERAPDEGVGFTQDQQRNEYGDDRIEEGKAGYLYQNKSDHNTYRGEDIGPQMPGIAFKGDGIRRFSHFHQFLGHEKVQTRRDPHHDHTDEEKIGG